MTDYEYREWERYATSIIGCWTNEDARNIARLAKEARLQTLRAEMLEEVIRLNSAKTVVREMERLEFHMASSADKDAVVEANRAYDEARMAWMLMGGKE